MPIHEYKFASATAVVSIVRLAAPEPEVLFDDAISKIKVGLAPEDEISGAVVGINIHTHGGTTAVMLIFTPADAAEVAWLIAQAAGEADGESY